MAHTVRTGPPASAVVRANEIIWNRKSDGASHRIVPGARGTNGARTWARYVSYHWKRRDVVDSRPGYTSLGPGDGAPPTFSHRHPSGIASLHHCNSTSSDMLLSNVGEPRSTRFLSRRLMISSQSRWFSRPSLWRVNSCHQEDIVCLFWLAAKYSFSEISRGRPDASACIAVCSTLRLGPQRSSARCVT